MTTAVTNPNAAGLAALASLRTGLAQVRSTISSSVAGEPLLRLLKDGAWVMGREDNAVANGTEAIINPMSFQTGYSCWTNRAPGQGKNELMGEEMWGLNGQKPPASALPQHHDPRTQDLCAWREQMSVNMKFLDGPFEGTQALYKSSSVGGLRALTDMLDAIMRQIDSGSEYICPIIAISSDSYQHASYGRTYVPKLELVSWANMQGQEEGGEPDAVDVAIKEEPKPEPVAAPEGRRRRV